MNRRLFVCAAVTVACLNMMTGGASAAVSSCYTDPTITLSNGASMQLAAKIGTSLSNVQSVSYELHVPMGLKMTSVTYDEYGSLERLTFVADQKPGTYRDITTVAGPVGTAVQATAELSGIVCKQLPKWTNGSTSRPLVIPFSC